MTTADPIEFDDVVKAFGPRTVIDRLTFSVPRGSVVGLLGPNGAGKSTAMRVLLGLMPPSSGSARVLGREAGEPGFRDAVRKVGTIIESPPLYANATALQNLEIRVRAFGLSTSDANVRQMLNQVGLGNRADDKAKDYSLGMRQRLGIAIALVGDPEIVVLDEPTNGLDPEGTVEMRELIRALPERGATALLCTHRLSEVEATCDYVVVMQQGKLVAQGKLDEIISKAKGGGHRIGVSPTEVDGARQALRTLDLGDIRVEGGQLHTGRALEDPSRITAALAGAGIYVRELATEHATLEDAFLELTQDKPGGDAS